MRHKKWAIIVGFVLLTLFAIPKLKTTVWYFGSQNVSGNWEIRTITQVAPTNQGLHIKTSTSGHMMRDTAFTHPVDTISLTYMTGQNTDIVFQWHRRDSPPGELVIFPITLAKSTEPRTIHLNVGAYEQWDPHADRMGFAFPAGSDLLMKHVTLTGWNPLGKALQSLLSFWKFDDLRPHSINFLWGPMIATNPTARMYLFAHLPPLAHSANWILYGLLLCGCVVVLWKKFRHKPQPKDMQKIIVGFVLFVSGVWAVYDVRMGAEFLSYLQTDIHTYFNEPLGRRTFRERGHFYDFAQAIVPYTKGRSSYAFLSSYEWPYRGLMRYYTYPSVPVDTAAGELQTDTWIVFERPDVTRNASDQLMVEGEPISPPGAITHEFAPGTFIFRAYPPIQE